MPIPFNRWYPKLVAPSRKRGASTSARFRVRVERLEPRAMLSASIGMMPPPPELGMAPPPAHNFGPRDFEMAEFGQHTSYPDGGRRPVEYLGPTRFDGGRHDHFGWNDGPLYGGHNSQPMFIIVYEGLPRDRTPAPSQAPLPASKPEVETPPIIDMPEMESTPMAGQKPSPSSSAGGSLDSGNSPQSVSRPVSPSLVTSVVSDYLAPNTTAMLSSDVLSTTLSLNALETIFQRYASGELLLNTAALRASQNGDDLALETLADVSGATGVHLEPSEDATFDFAWESIVDQERIATNDVLRRLHDADALDVADSNSIHAQNSSDPSNETNDTVDAAFAAAANTADDGMFLLQATGDANHGQFNLVSAANNARETLARPLGIEASIGLHQAIDVATDGSLPVDNENDPAEPAAPLPEPGAQSRAAPESGQPLLREAAAMVGASIIFGLVRRTRTEKQAERH